MFLAAIIFAQAASAAASLPVTEATAADSSAAPLWRDLRVGMTVEDAASVLGKVDGVKAVKIKMKKKVPDSIGIEYVDDGILVGNQRFSIVPIFSEHLLRTVALSNEQCATAAVEQAKLLATSLAEKYPNKQMVSIVDENNVRQDRQAAFWNDHTHVQLSMQPIAPPERAYLDEYAGGFMGAANKLANAMNRGAVEAAMNACPNDAGYKLRTVISYSSQATFMATHDAEANEREANAKARKDAL